MHILVLGGTQFIGRHIVEQLLAPGHAVSVLTRGQTPDPLPEDVERLRGNRDSGSAGLFALEGRRWDACVDVSGYTGVQVRASAELLRDSVHRYVYISAVSAYGDPSKRPVTESQPLQPAAAEDVTVVDGETYGALKVTCEHIVREVFGERATVLRPQIVVGPFDPSGRYDYWLSRAARGGEMLAPGDGSDHLQMIDVRDLARFVVRVIEADLAGAFNMAGPRITWAEFVRLLGAQNVVWVPAGLLTDLNFMQLPLYRPEYGPRASLMDVSAQRALAAGLTLSDPEVTARDTRPWSLAQSFPEAITAEQEAELIARARQG